LWDSLGYSMDKIEVVMNRYSSKSAIQIEDFEKAIGKKVARCLPADSDGVQESLLKGLPTVQIQPKSEFSRTISDWASDFSGKPREEKSLWRRFGIK
jgi:pilus assembly protein CpaE